ncbi:MAG: hypothetical protein Q8M85_01480 [Tabrizicola sp.]|nr:hypothetical protein [Tabrizicola sp.]MDP3193917.1 hypothetical protein [Tabrizicola sp.]
MGLAPIIVARLFNVVKGLKVLDVTVLLVEQNACGALRVADRGYVMKTGRIAMDRPLAKLTPAKLIADPRLCDAYLGI